MKIDLSYFNKMLSVFLEADMAHITLYDFDSAGVNYINETGDLEEKFLYHFQLLVENELIGRRDLQPADLSGMGIRFGLGGGCTLSIIPIRLTQKGHDFALSLNNKEVLERLKNELNDAPFKVLFEGGQKLLQHIAKKKLDALIEE